MVSSTASALPETGITHTNAVWWRAPGARWRLACRERNVGQDGPGVSSCRNENKDGEENY